MDEKTLKILTVHTKKEIKKTSKRIETATTEEEKEKLVLFKKRLQFRQLGFIEDLDRGRDLGHPVDKL